MRGQWLKQGHGERGSAEAEVRASCVTQGIRGRGTPHSEC